MWFFKSQSVTGQTRDPPYTCSMLYLLRYAVTRSAYCWDQKGRERRVPCCFTRYASFLETNFSSQILRLIDFVYEARYTGDALNTSRRFHLL